MSKPAEQQYRIVNSDTGRRLMDYASRAHADAWLATHRGFRVYSQHADSHAMGLHAIYVEQQAARLRWIVVRQEFEGLA